MVKKFYVMSQILLKQKYCTTQSALYEFQVLDVIVNKDQRGRKAVEYLIHFQGWNSSWDRCVTEEYVLKDTEENRQLQRDLAQKAQLQLGAYLYRRERKKRSHKLSERLHEAEHQEPRRRARSGGSRATSATTGSSEDGSSGQHADYDTEGVNTEEDTESSSDYVGETSDDEDSGGGSQSGVRPGIDLDIGTTLRRILDQDYDLITNKNKLAVLPAQPTVANILESWVQHYTTTQLTNIPEKPQRNKANNTIEKAINEINICREVADGLRIYFDFTLHDLLLYRQEKEQYCNLKSSFLYNEYPTLVKEEPIEHSEVLVKEEYEDTEYAHLPPFQEHEQETDTSKILTNSKRRLRSCRVSSIDENRPLKFYEEIKQDTGNMSSIASTSSRCSSPRGVTLRIPVVTSAQINALLQQSNKWRLMPERSKSDSPPNPSTYYGAIHLTRLFVKLPDLLQLTDIPHKKLKVLLKYLDMFLSYLEMHREWFGEQFYMQAENQLISQENNS
ncbi:male-specific lethal 3 isoform X2 [Megachile rotundata]|uniref:male-specific lethal 3 isoform X2 n=1 Tax=Megachile rotundata TaxID=143995 RepID=UPI000614CFA9|nr:PREDICTED: male-specific lethal 3 homolog isoform X2 [Megachile rotundata]XP_012144144.1 PREDICTED: male-specific lethal 3 homolog isoform X2 [Megachile rotundata]XP_012144145.1 PREDICTED: male-specific lethal 3 homolog isoform X2 [Megachile rotundata]